MFTKKCSITGSRVTAAISNTHGSTTRFIHDRVREHLNNENSGGGGRGGGRGEGEREIPLSFFPSSLSPIPYPLPLSTPATQAMVNVFLKTSALITTLKKLPAQVSLENNRKTFRRLMELFATFLKMQTLKY